jgi:secreted trypsin-like serine protease
MLKRLLLVAVFTASALLTPSAAKPLIGGEATGTTSYTNVGAFGIMRNDAFSEICSGTLIAPNAVLTAGHCTFFFDDLE